MVDEVVDGHVRPHPPALVDRGVPRDPEKERHERKSAVLISVERFHGAYEHVGYQVLRLMFRPGPRQAVPIDRVAIDLVELPEPCGLSGLAGLDERAAV